MTWITDFIDLIFPNACIGCKDHISSGNRFLCYICEEKLPYTHHFQLQGNELYRKLSPVMELEQAAALFYFEEQSIPQKLIHQFKYHQKKELAYQMGCLIGSELNNTDWIEKIDCLIPVPLHKGKLNQRGYNQAEYIARGISDFTEIPVRTDALFRLTNTSSQTAKNKEERLRSVISGFKWDLDKIEDVQNIALIDDVVTTGATASACFKGIQDLNKDLYLICLAMDR